ncbi:MAG: glycosyltransferase family 2 protein [Lachnospiraceae bacterium]|nr:glycosyltransferase family 2 protein [Lachnospiraceae bacterium]
MGNALISIIIPVYNAAEYLERSVGSVRKQTYRNLEIITVDDGSKDDSLKLLNSFAASDSRVKVIHKENGGSSSARNAGLKAATGEYIGFIDADDYIEFDMYENLSRILDEDPKTDVSQILSCEENENGDLIKAFGEGFTEEVEQTGKDFFRALLLHRGDSSFCTKLFRREFFEGFSFPEGRLNEDFDLLVKMSEKLELLKVCREPGYHIVLSTESNTRGTYRQSFYENVMENAEKMLALSAKKYPGLKEEAAHFYLVQAMWLLLHIPVSEMNRGNALYTKVYGKVKSHKRFIRRDPYLTKKQRRNLLIFAYLPAKSVKRLFGIIKKTK